MNRLSFLIPFFCLLQSAAVTASELPSVTHYNLAVRFHLKEQRVSIVATLSIRNSTAKSCTTLPFLLYRLLTVENISSRLGPPLAFTQEIGQLTDEPSLQARQVTVDLASPLAPDDSVTIVLAYGGFIFGYPEVMAYVQDRIDEIYSLLRPDAFAYPVLAEPTFASAIAANDTRFTYEVAATVPDGYRVACGGELSGSHSDSTGSTFVFHSKIPTWRIDVAVARFAILDSPDDLLTVYYLPGDSAGATTVMNASKRVINLFSEMFGRPESYKGYTIIEIPDGWGSQASDFYFLQTAASFRDTSKIPEVYHEIGHSWNAPSAGEIQRCRYFDEAFASFFESLAIGAFNGKRSFEEDMEKGRDIFVRWANHDRQVFDTPIAEYGKKELGRHSYTKGAWSLYVLHTLVGEKEFASIVRTMLTTFKGRAINFRDFQTLCEQVTHRNLKKFFDEWIFGAASSKLMVDKVTIAEIVRRY